ncbi:MAG: sulfatase [Cyclobacteriaceae bacterium]
MNTQQLNKKTHKILTLVVSILFFSGCTNSGNSSEEQISPNILIIIADDVSYDSFGFAGGVAPDVTPNIDRLANEGLSFAKAFSTVAVCQPSRQSMLTGLIPNHYGSQGFFPMKPGTPNLPTILRKAGYLTGIIHKQHHLQPEEDFNWNYENERLGLTDPDGMVGRNPKLIASGLRKMIDDADKEGKPFFMFAGSADAHRPFHGDPPNKNITFWGNGKVEISFPDPSRIYSPNEVTVTPALPDIRAIRTDLAKYASSIRRLDDMVGECLKVLDETNKSENTLVIFVSDNGMPLAFGKFDTYLGSNHSPLLMKWPKRIKKGTSIEKHLVSLMDITPTVLELAGLEIPSPIDGKSLVPFINNNTPETWRESIIFIRNQDIYYGDALKTVLKRNPDFSKKLEAIGWRPSTEHEVEGTHVRDKEIRTFYDGKYGYIYNNCYREDGLEKGSLGTIVPYNGQSIRAMRAAGESDPAVKKRFESYLLRAPEELYDWSKDPGSQVNLAGNPEYGEVLSKARKGLLNYMKSANDPLTEVFEDMIQ